MLETKLSKQDVIKNLHEAFDIKDFDLSAQEAELIYRCGASSGDICYWSVADYLNFVNDVAAEDGSIRKVLREYDWINADVLGLPNKVEVVLQDLIDYIEPEDKQNINFDDSAYEYLVKVYNTEVDDFDMEYTMIKDKPGLSITNIEWDIDYKAEE